MLDYEIINTESMKLLKELALEIGVGVSDKQLKECSVFGGLLIDWNKKFNLTSIENEEDIVLKHFVDSLSLMKYIPLCASSQNTAGGILNFVDVGAGAGFPGIPVKIFLKEKLDIVLIEAVGKKVRFMEEVIRVLGLQRVKPVHIRAEDAGRKEEYRGVADIAAARAVASIPVLLEYCIPLLKPGGIFLAMKSANETVDKEISDSKNAADVLGCVIEEVDRFFLPRSSIKRAVVVVRKVRETPAKFPRKAGTPAKTPL